MNRAMTINIDTHADNYNFVTKQNMQYGYCWRFIPLFAGALHACAGQASDRINKIIN